MLRLSKLVPVRGAAVALIVLVLTPSFIPPAHAIDPSSPALPARDDVMVRLWDLLTLVFIGDQNRGQIDPDGAQAEGDNRGQIDPDGAQVEEDGDSISPNG